PWTVLNYLYAGIGNESAQWLIFIIAVFGLLIALFEKSNAVVDFGFWARKFIKTPKQALVGTYILGWIIFLEDYLNNLTVGTTMKGMTDRLGVPRLQLAFVVNTVAAPVCLLIPMSSWAVYYGKLLEDQNVTVNGSGMGAYIAGLPYAFYAYVILAICLLQILGVIPKVGSLKKAWKRVEETGDVFPEGTEANIKEEAQAALEMEEGDEKHLPFNFLIPMIVMIIVTIAAGIDVLMGSAAGCVVAIIMYLVQRKMTFFEILEAGFQGMMNMGFVFVLTVLAFAVQTVNTDLGLADFVIEIASPIMKGAFLPASTFIVCGIYAYATGCFWDLAAIIIPIVIPLATAVGADPLLVGAAVFSGSALGSNTCLYGDGVILCSQGCQVKPVDLMMTTLPYAAAAGVISVILYIGA
ncbi:MAG: TRAP transporter large permease subunit, partial [Parasporobacterium sp.]|nr:TRAP transporter large permease subunit [Parasporobacterium sp.]